MKHESRQRYTYPHFNHHLDMTWHDYLFPSCGKSALLHSHSLITVKQCTNTVITSLSVQHQTLWKLARDWTLHFDRWTCRPTRRWKDVWYRDLSVLRYKGVAYY